MQNANGEEEFMCPECHRFKLVSQKGKATLNGEPYEVCQSCCEDEQKKQFYCSF